MGHRSYQNSKQKKIIPIAIGIVMVIIVGLGIYIMSSKLESAISPVNSSTDGISTHPVDAADGKDNRVYIMGKWYEPKENIRTTLLIGVDEFGAIRDKDAYNNSSQADFLLLLAKDDKTGDTFAIQINRDTMTPVQTLSVSGDVAGREDMQVALSHAYGSGKEDSCLNTEQAVSYFLYNYPIDNYISMSMDGIAIMNDEVGGVTLKSMEDMDSLGVKKDEVITLKNDQALTYVRERDLNDDESNIKRQDRQRQYILAWSDLAKDKFKSTKAATELIDHISPYLITDCDAMTLASMAEELSEYETAPIYVPEGTLKKGEKWMEFYADNDALRDLVLDLFYEEVDVEG